LRAIPAIYLAVLVSVSGCIQPNSFLSVSSSTAGASGQSSELSLSQGQELDGHTKRSIRKFGSIIQKYSLKYELDWRLVLAVMRQESQFQPDARSQRGAYGLMQIMPVTEQEISEQLGIPQAKSPYYNIKAGVYHLKRLYRFFDGIREPHRTKLTLAAYNAGLSRILDARDLAEYLGHDPDTWEGVREALPFLTKRYQTLHSRVWGDEGPRSGYFRNFGETVNYVDKIMRSYQEYRLALR
jgi:membrane-bound lytic murein transglycosylase F